jgi:hypothetical protein
LFLYFKKGLNVIVRLIKNALLAGIPFGLLMGLLFAFMAGIYIGIFLGVVCGLLFGLAIAIFLELMRKNLGSKESHFEGEKIIHQGAANHFQGIEGRGGWLILTSNRLIFKSHGMNIQNQALSLEMQNIANVSAVKTAGIIPNGLLINKKDGSKEQFVVSGRQEWVKYISPQLSAP